LPLEAGLDSSLVCSAGVLQPEGHGVVAVRAKQGDECGLLLVFFLDRDLVVAGVAVKEVVQVAARRRVETWSIRGNPNGSLGQCLLRSV
jgi:hypothetical protein